MVKGQFIMIAQLDDASWNSVQQRVQLESPLPLSIQDGRPTALN